MSGSGRSPIRVRLIAVDPPFRTEHRVLFGLQDKRGAVDAVPATKTTAFETEIEIIGGAGLEAGPDVRGDHVHGRKGDRFLYLSWGTPDRAEPFVMFARAKVKLADVPADLFEPAADGVNDLVCRLAATDDRGQPASGTINPPAVSWHRAEQPEPGTD